MKEVWEEVFCEIILCSIRPDLKAQTGMKEKKVLIVHGRGFNWADPDHFRIVYLPRIEILRECMEKMADFLAGYQQK